jgi:FtsP/CotA-like multicopper oxidase with cupredoxin domain
MKSRALFLSTFLLAVVLVMPVTGYTHGEEKHDKGSGEGSMDLVMTETPKVEDAGYITYTAPTGMDVTVGKKNPLKTLEYETVTDDQGRKVKIFRLTVNDVKFEVSPGKIVEGWGFNGQIPGPTIRMTEGDRIRIVFTNKTKDEHTIHVHGQNKPLSMDGIPYLSQKPVEKDETFTYEFTVTRAGTHWYHCHVDSGHHVDMGMYGAFIVDPKKEVLKFDREYTLIVDEWPSGHKHIHSGAMTTEEHEEPEHGVVTEHKGTPRHDDKNQSMKFSPMTDGDHKDVEMNMQAGPGEMENMDQMKQMGTMKKPQRDWYPKTYNAYNPVYDTFTINGKAFPYTEPLIVKKGERIRIRIINAGYEPHFMHTHSHRFLVVARDGNPVKDPPLLDTVEVAPGKRVDILLEADNPGVWPFHCHNLLHVSNDNVYPGGMLTFIKYEE